MLSNVPRICPQISSKMVLIMTKLLKERRTWPCSLTLQTFFARSHASLRAHRSCCKVSSCVRSSILGAQGLRSWGSHFWITPLRWTLHFRFLTWCRVPFENLTVRSDPKDFVLFRKSTSISAALYPGKRNPNVLIPSIRLLILFHHFSSAFCWSDCQPQNRHLSPNLHPNSVLWCWHTEDVNNHTTDSYNFL